MILECSECHMRYIVPDTAIGADGRTVRCANCKHSWFQAGAPIPDPAPVPQFLSPEPEAPAAAPPVESPRPVVPAPTVPVASEASPGSAATAAPRPPLRRPRRNPAKRWTVAAVAAGVAMLLGTGAILYTGAPGIAAQLGLPIGEAETPLRFAEKAIDRRDLPSGAELFAVTGRVINPTDTRQRVPDIRAELRDSSSRLVYSWTIAPPTRFLAPNSSLEFNSAKLDVPANSKMLQLSFAGESAD